MKEGSIVSGKITGIKDYGAFVKVENYDGLIHISEFSDDYVRSIENIVNIGDVVSLQVLSIDESESRLKLSYKRVNKHKTNINDYSSLEIGYNTIDENYEEWVKIGYLKLNEFNHSKKK